MSDDERDYYESDADKRAHHNALERKRRDNMKDSFIMLRDALPIFQGDKAPVRASRAQILKKAADYIGTLKKKNIDHQHDIDEMRRQSRALDEQIRLLQKSKSPENLASSSVVVENAKMTLKNVDTFHGSKYADSSDSEDSSDDSDSNNNSRK